MSRGKVVIVGGGFIGKPLAVALKNLGYSPEVILKSDKRIADFQLLEIPTYVQRVGEEVGFIEPFAADVLILAYPIGARSGDCNPEAHAHWLAKHFHPNKIQQVVLVSSTSVYPDGFGLVNEYCTRPPQDHGVIQLQYEEAIGKIYGEKVVLFRCGGLVGAERQPGRFLAGRVNLPNPKSPVNMVHQLDVVRFVAEAVVKGTSGEVFNLCADAHPTREEYYTEAARKIGLPEPTFSEQQIPNPKVVDNTKSKQFFGLDYAGAIYGD